MALILTTMAAGAKTLSPGPLSFTLTETSGKAGARVATVSFPFAKGEVSALSAVSVTRVRDGQRRPTPNPSLKGGESETATIPAQVRVLQLHPDGSVRRALLRFVWNPSAGQTESFMLNVLKTASKAPGQLSEAKSNAFSLRAG
ncbi:MAG: hypothetical protein WCP21_20935, partial [Armatimonadota bacterium]